MVRLLCARRQTISSPAKDTTGRQRRRGDNGNVSLRFVVCIGHHQMEGGSGMQCYVCAKAGKQTEAVGVCIVCGMGLCMDHALRELSLIHISEPTRLGMISYA